MAPLKWTTCGLDMNIIMDVMDVMGETDCQVSQVHILPIAVQSFEQLYIGRTHQAVTTKLAISSGVLAFYWIQVRGSDSSRR